MSDLDSKLRKILDKVIDGSERGMPLGAGVAQIKQVYWDADYRNLNDFGYMTGQEWYRKFTTELNQMDAHEWNNDEYAGALKAAKKASRIEREEL